MCNITKYLEESIKLELKVSELYFLFASEFKQDYNFWWKLSIEEKNHASILKTGLQFANNNEKLCNIVKSEIGELIATYNYIEDIIKNFKHNPIRKNAFKIALQIENSVSESHYQETMTTETDDQIINIFKKLNKDDIDHYNRIKEYSGEI